MVKKKRFLPENLSRDPDETDILSNIPRFSKRLTNPVYSYRQGACSDFLSVTICAYSSSPEDAEREFSAPPRQSMADWSERYRLLV